MKKEDKSKAIEQIKANLSAYENFYLVDIASLDAGKTSQLRRECAKGDIKLTLVKNTLLHKALESLENDYSALYPILKGNTAIMFSNVPNAPAKLIDKYRKEQVPSLKAAYVQESFFIGAESLPSLVDIKSKAELLGEVVTLLQFPAKNVISALQSGGTLLHGVLKTLSEKEN